MDDGRLFAVPEQRKPPQHYAKLLAATGSRYGLMLRPERQRFGAVAWRLISNGIPERRIVEEGARLRAALGRPPTLAEIADRLLG